MQYPVASNAAGPPSAGPDEVALTLRVNGETRTLLVDPRSMLLDALRERLALTGTKKGRDGGACGACTVLVDGRRFDSCLTLALMHEDQELTTIAGLARGEALHSVQAAFLEQVLAHFPGVAPAWWVVFAHLRGEVTPPCAESLRLHPHCQLPPLEEPA